MMPMRANIAGPPDVATRIKASIAACHCSAFGSEKIQKIASDLFDLESPLLKARNLAMAIHRMSSGDELRGESGDALFAVADSMLEILEGIEKTREKILRLAREQKREKPSAKNPRGTLRLVDADSAS